MTSLTINAQLVVACMLIAVLLAHDGIRLIKVSDAWDDFVSGVVSIIAAMMITAILLFHA